MDREKIRPEEMHFLLCIYAQVNKSNKQKTIENSLMFLKTFINLLSHLTCYIMNINLQH